MKKTLIKRNATKTLRFLSYSIAAAIVLTSCKKEDDNTISDSEMAEVILETVSPSSGGMVTQTESVARQAGTTSLDCGSSNDSTITGSNAAGAVVTYNYNLLFNRTLTCESGEPSLFTANFTGSSSFIAPKVSSNDNSNAQIAVSGLGATASAFTINQSYVRNGTQQSSVRFERSFQSTITITSANIMVDKTSYEILSGTAGVQFSASASGGYTTNRGATLTFLGARQATLSLDNGSNYSIQW